MSKNNFGIASLFSQQPVIYYEVINSPFQIGRVADLLGVLLSKNSIHDTAMRMALAISLGEACRNHLGMGAEAGTIDPIMVECGSGDEKIYVGVSFTLDPARARSLEDIKTRLAKSSPKDEFERQMLELTRYAESVSLQVDAEKGYCEICLQLRKADAHTRDLATNPEIFELSMISPENAAHTPHADYKEIADVQSDPEFESFHASPTLSKALIQAAQPAAIAEGESAKKIIEALKKEKDPAELLKIVEKSFTEEELKNLVAENLEPQEVAKILAQDTEAVSKILAKQLSEEEKEKLVSGLDPEQKAEILVEGVPDEVAEILKKKSTPEELEEVVVKGLPPEAQAKALVKGMKEEELQRIVQSNLSPEEQAEVLIKGLSEKEAFKIVKGSDPEDVAFQRIKGEEPEEEFIQRIAGRLREDEKAKLVKGAALESQEIAQIVVRGTPPEQLAKTLIRGLPKDEAVDILKSLPPSEVMDVLSKKLSREELKALLGDDLELIKARSATAPISKEEQEMLTTFVTAAPGESHALADEQIQRMVSSSMPTVEVETILKTAVPETVVETILSGKAAEQDVREVIKKIAGSAEKAEPIIKTIYKTIQAKRSDREQIAAATAAEVNVSVVQENKPQPRDASAGKMIEGLQKKVHDMQAKLNEAEKARSQAVQEMKRAAREAQQQSGAAGKNSESETFQATQLSEHGAQESSESSQLGKKTASQKGVESDSDSGSDSGSEHVSTHKTKKNKAASSISGEKSDVEPQEDEFSSTGAASKEEATPSSAEEMRKSAKSGPSSRSSNEMLDALTQENRKLELALKKAEQDRKRLQAQLQSQTEKRAGAEPQRSRSSGEAHSTEQDPGHDSLKTAANRESASAQDRFEASADPAALEREPSGKEQLLQRQVKDLQTQLRRLEEEKRTGSSASRKEKIEERKTREAPLTEARPAPNTPVPKEMQDPEGPVDEKDHDRVLDFYKNKVRDLENLLKDARDQQRAIPSSPEAAPEREVITVEKTVESSAQGAQASLPEAKVEDSGAEETQKVEKSFSSLQKNLDVIKKEVTDKKAQARLEGFVQEMQTKRAEIAEMTRRMTGAFRKKEFDLKTSEFAAQEDLKKTKGLLNQKQQDNDRLQVMVSKLLEKVDGLKATQSANSSDGTNYKVKFEMGQRQVETLQREVLRLSKQKANNAASQVAANLQVAREDEMKKLLDSSNKAVALKKQEIEQLKKMLHEKTNKELELKQIITRLQQDPKNSPALKKKAG